MIDRGLLADAEARRSEFRDAYRAGLTSVVTDAELAKDDISTILIRASSMAGNLAEGWGPRTEYLDAANLLTVYLHLVERAAASERDSDGALLQIDAYGELTPWSRARPRRVEDILTFRPEAVERWNRIVAQGPPPEYAPRAGRGAPKRHATAGRTTVQAPGHRRHRSVELPLGLEMVVHPGGPDARLVYSIIKTPGMSATTPEGRLAILEAVVARVLDSRYDESYAAVAAHDLMQVSTGAGRGVVYANAPADFERLSPGMEFTFEVGLTFLLHLDDVTNGAVPWSLITKLDPHVEVRKKDEPKPLWQELFPRATTRERAYWAHKRMEAALPLWDPKLGRRRPGTFYPGYAMYYVSDGPFAGDEIWATKDYRIYQVNERAALLEGFRTGVLQASGAVALAYALIGLSLMLVEGPAMIAMLARLRFPMQLAREFLFALRTRPLALLGNVAVDQGMSVILSGGWDSYVDSLDEPEGWLGMFFGVLGATHSVLHLPSGPKLRIEGGELVPVKSAGAHVAPSAGAEPLGATTSAPRPAPQPTRPAAQSTSPAPQPSRTAPQSPMAAPHSTAAPHSMPTPPSPTAATRSPGAANPSPKAAPRAPAADPASVVIDGGGRGRPRPRRKRGARAQDVRARRDEQPRQKLRDTRGVKGSKGTRNRGTRRGEPTPTEFTFTRAGVRYHVTVSPEGARAYDAIPIGDTVVYALYDSNGTMIYVGITERTPKRAALARLKEHLTTKDHEFIGEAAEFRLLGNYDSPRQAHALEHDIVTEKMPRYNRDVDPWKTYLQGPDFELIRRRAGPEATSVDVELRELGSMRRRGDDLEDWSQHVPRRNLDISFSIEQ